MIFTWWEKMLIGIWIGFFVANLTIMFVVGTPDRVIRMRAKIEEIAGEGK